MEKKTAGSGARGARISADNLRCEYLENPIGIEDLRPRLSWEVKASRRGAEQSAYRVLAASSVEILSSGRGDLWDSGRVNSDSSVLVRYRGRGVGSGTRCWWKVKVWDEEGVESDFSSPAFWETGLLKKSDWKAEWITKKPKNKWESVWTTQYENSPVFRKTVRLKGKVRSARAYICGLGYYELRINGGKAGENVLEPVFTNYDKRVLYLTHDVTGRLRKGKNAIGIMLGNGWYNMHTIDNKRFSEAPWRDLPKVMMQVRVMYEDGSEEIIKTDGSWNCAEGPIVMDSLRNGEFYNALQEKKGWDTPGYREAGREWEKAVGARAPKAKLAAHQMPPVKIIRTVKPVSVEEVQPGVYRYDMGEDIAGHARLRVSGPAGRTVTLTYTELPDEDSHPVHRDGRGHVPNDSYTLSGKFQTDKYTLRGEGEESWEPRFTYHGFRYVLVKGFPGKPGIRNLEGRVTHTALERRGEFECSKKILNQVHEICMRGWLNNFVGNPTDCPTREKCHWNMGNVGVYQFLNYETVPSYRKWLCDFRDAQQPGGKLPAIIPTAGWGYEFSSGFQGDAGAVLLPWYIYVCRGDRDILRENYGLMKRLWDYYRKIADGWIVDFGLGDWLAPRTTPSRRKAVRPVTGTCYYYLVTVVLSKIADVIGENEDSVFFARSAGKIRAVFNRKYHDPRTGKVGLGGQTEQAMAIFSGILPRDGRDKAAGQLVEDIKRFGYTLNTGLTGTFCIWDALAETGNSEYAYALATTKKYPGYGYMLKHGATAMWEGWNGTCSRTHVTFQDVDSWFFKDLAGINPDPSRPGFKHVIIRPRPAGDLKWARAEHFGPYGRIFCEWKLTSARFSLRLDIPANTRASVYFPAEEPGRITEGRFPAQQAEGVSIGGRYEDGWVFAAGSGSYEFATDAENHMKTRKPLLKPGKRGRA